MSEKSEIQEYFNKKTIFITGGTGFLGKLIIEKLLRACYDLEKIYILVRTKKGVTENERFHTIFAQPCFEPLKEKYPDFFQKVRLIQGDLVKPNLGLSPEDIATIKREVNVIFHVAATVRFDQHLKTAAYINVRATRDLLQIAKETNNLEVFVYVSTAYSYSPMINIEEKFYEAPISGDNLLKIVDLLDDQTITDITPSFKKAWPNTYAFTKAVSEDVVQKHGQGLPIAVVRPSIITATYREPIPGWVDNFYGIIGYYTAISSGLLRVGVVRPADMHAELVSADYVINHCIVAAWDISKKNTSARIVSHNVPVYNFVSQNDKYVPYSKIEKLFAKVISRYPTEKAIWVPFLLVTESDFVFKFLFFTLHTLPAHVVDFVLRIIGKQPILVNAYKKIEKFNEMLVYFSTNQFYFKSDNVKLLWNGLSNKDQDIFPFNPADVDLDESVDSFQKGARLYLLKEPMDTLDKAKAWRKKLLVIHYAFCAFLLFVLYKIVQLVVMLFI